MKALSEQIRSIIISFEQNIGYDEGGITLACITRPLYEKIVKQITSLIEQNYYPKEFVMWLIFEDHKFYFDGDKYKFYDEAEDYNASLNEVFEYWKDNIKDK